MISDLLFPLFITIALLFLTIFFLLQQFDHVFHSHSLRSALLDHGTRKNLLQRTRIRVFVRWNNGILFSKFFCLLWEGAKRRGFQELGLFARGRNRRSDVFISISHLNGPLKGWRELVLSVGWRIKLWEKTNLMVVEISAE